MIQAHYTFEIFAYLNASAGPRQDELEKTPRLWPALTCMD